MRHIGLRLLALAALCAAMSAAAGAKVDLSAGAARLRFHDSRLRDPYPHPIALRARAQVARIDGVPLTLSASYAWADARPAPVAFVDDARVRLRFVPLCVQAPYPLSLGRGWIGRIGPQAAWVWFREEWNARVDEAGVDAAANASGTWLAGGALLEVGSPPTRWGALRLGVSGMWASADRRAERGNEKREGDMKGGWDEIFLEWVAPRP